jgi:16S rRNA G527 N7-methylase RsmG
MVSVKNGLDKMHRLVDILADEVEKSIVKLQAVEGEDEDEDDERQKLITRAVNNMNKILEISQVLPKNIASLQSLQEQIQKEQSTTTTVLGGGAVGAFED